MAGKRGPARVAGLMSFSVPAVLLGGLLAAASSWACDAVPVDGCPTAPFRSAELFLDNHLKPVFIDSRLIWHWRQFPATIADFGSPDTTSNFELCIYDYAGGVPSLRFAFSIPAGGQCGKSRCWKRTPTGWSYRNLDGDPDGIVLMTFQSNESGGGDIVIKGGGPLLPPFGLPLVQDPEVAAQLNSSDGLCWTTRFHDARRNYRGQFTARSK